MKDNPRFIAIELLNKTFQNNGYSNIQLSAGLNNSKLEERDKRLCSMIYYGVIERKITLDYIISNLSNRSVKKLDITILNILRCGIYQMLYMDNIPDSASVNESVKLAKAFKKTSASGLVNAILRNFIRNEKQFPVPMDILKSSMIKYSVNEWVIDSLIKDYGIEKADILLSNALEKPPITARLNNLKNIKSEIAFEGLEFEKCNEIPDCFEIKSGDVTTLNSFKNGLFHVQDKASQLCCLALNPTENDVVLDLCSAPGGKTFTMAELMQGKGKVYAFDIHDKRVNLIKKGAERLGLSNVVAMMGDASKFNSELPKATKILCDVPCSGVGVIRRKPEIKYKDVLDFENLPQIQYKILENALNYLEIGGELVYSTCTLRKAENDDVIDKLLENHPELEGVSFLNELGSVFGSYKVTIFPDSFNSDGFFISKIKKVR